MKPHVDFLRKYLNAEELKGNSQQLDPVCTVFVEKVPLEPTIPLNDGCPAYLVFIILKNFPPFREIFKK
ncbi:hypothetical protein AVEN_200375-1 [Araneus ventricosus]|uniref:Uncharacterized protein n=1 Tax=Araneus ventricosus TaxID=182803 RepID=A0A4Y2GYQ6_ARAVE|nr:hypothetical protein AVEN_200375-1 [Araneus ventricosus]